MKGLLNNDIEHPCVMILNIIQYIIRKNMFNVSWSQKQLLAI